MEPFCLGKPSDPGRTGSDGRLFLEAILWIARTGSPWRDLPPAFGKWNTVFKRFRDWVKADVFKRMFDAVSDPLGSTCVACASFQRVPPVLPLPPGQAHSRAAGWRR
jgi:transposase